ncbi:uncharacterized protein [Typha angustifolia]|uniref:uncharacterized protein n=1 Tax=Typha angustifolia TaxID=59011 RepID=UPI003C2D44B1
MAPKRPAAAPRPSSSSSSDDDQEVNLATPSPNRSTNKSPNNPLPKPTNPSDEDEDEEGSTDEGSGSESDHNPRPPSSQPRSQPQPPVNPSGSGSTESGSDSDESGEPAPVQPAPVQPAKPKKPPPPSDGPQNKKKKPSLEAPPEQKKQLFQRVWALDDEIAVLRWLGDFRAKNGSLPAQNDALAEFVRRTRGLEVSNVQINDKLRRLKKRYTANAAREMSTGKGPSKPHEGFVFDLSKKVWGGRNQSSGNAGAQSDESDSDESNARLGPRQNDKVENNTTQMSGKLENEKPETEKGKLPYPYFREAVEELANEHPRGATMKRAFEFLDESKAKVMEEKIKKQTVIELKQHLRRMDLKKEVAKMMLEAITKADS